MTLIFYYTRRFITAFTAVFLTVLFTSCTSINNTPQTPAEAYNSYYADSNADIPNVHFDHTPELVEIPDTYVYVVRDAENIFFYDGWWWRSWNGYWYRSTRYNSGWRHYHRVPNFYHKLPHDWRNHRYRKSMLDNDWKHRHKKYKLEGPNEHPKNKEHYKDKQEYRNDDKNNRNDKRKYRENTESRHEKDKYRENEESRHEKDKYRENTERRHEKFRKKKDENNIEDYQNNESNSSGSEKLKLEDRQ